MDTQIPNHTQKICDELGALSIAASVVGVQPFVFQRASAMLREQAQEISRLTSQEAYINGKNDGWKAAMATGLSGDLEAAEQWSGSGFGGRPTDNSFAIYGFMVSVAALGAVFYWFVS